MRIPMGVRAAMAAALLWTGAAAAEELDIAPAIAAAGAWLEHVDGGRYGTAWEQAAELFRARVPEAEWQKAVVAARGPLGRVLARKMRSATYMRTPPGAPAGDYVVIQYDTVFRDRPLALETVTPMRDKDGEWRVSGYYVR